MNQHHPIHVIGERCEPYEQLSVFLPASILHTLRQQVPAGQRRAFIARALVVALQEQDTAETMQTMQGMEK